jgi:hypothetical protein
LASIALGAGSFASTDVGKTINVNDGVLVLTATDGSYEETTAPTSTDQAASGEWSMFAVVYDATDDVLEVSGLVSGFAISSASFVDAFSVVSQESTPSGIAFNSDGSKMFVVGYNGDDVNEYTLSTGFDVSTASFVDSFSVASQDTSPRAVSFNTDGTKMFILGDANLSVYEYTLSTGFDVSTASFVDSFSISSQDTDPFGMAFNTDGTKMFITGRIGQDVNEYTLSTGFDISTSSFVDSFSIAAQDTSPRGIAFNSDGTKMFVVGNTGKDVNEYTLGTGFDVSTATFVDNFSVLAQDTDPQGIAFNSDGTKMFVVGLNGQDINEYLTSSVLAPTGYQPAISNNIDSTYWTDINSLTATNAIGDGNVFYAVSNDARDSWSVLDNTSGTRDIVRNNAGTWQYNSNGTYGSETWTNATTNTEVSALREAMEGAEGTPTNPFDVSTAVYSKSFSVAGEDTQPQDLTFNTDGTKMFVVGGIGDDINEYSLSTGFDVSTASFTNSFSVASQQAPATGVAFNTTGTKMFIVGDTSDNVGEYTLTTGFDVSTASYSQNFSIATEETAPEGISFNTDGTKMFIVGRVGDAVYEYALSTGFDVSTASFTASFSVASQDINPHGIAFNTDGTKMFVAGVSGADVNEYTLSTGFDVSTASFVDSFSVSAQDGSPYGVAFNTNGTKMFIVGIGTDSVYQYSVGTASYTNQMDSTALNAITDANQITLGNDLGFAAILYIDSGTTVPTYSGTAINYDANILNQGAVLGTDYNFDFPAANKVRITSLAAQNLKVRII